MDPVKARNKTFFRLCIGAALMVGAFFSAMYFLVFSSKADERDGVTFVANGVAYTVLLDDQSRAIGIRAEAKADKSVVSVAVIERGKQSRQYGLELSCPGGVRFCSRSFGSPVEWTAIRVSDGGSTSVLRNPYLSEISDFECVEGVRGRDNACSRYMASVVTQEYIARYMFDARGRLSDFRVISDDKNLNISVELHDGRVLDCTLVACREWRDGKPVEIAQATADGRIEFRKPLEWKAVQVSSLANAQGTVLNRSQLFP